MRKDSEKEKKAIDEEVALLLCDVHYAFLNQSI